MPSRAPSVRVVVTCAGRKTAPAPESLRLRHHNGETVDLRAETWLQAIRSESATEWTAAKLYGGVYWSSAYNLRTAPAVKELWIASAGYGLLAPTTAIKSYDATFTRGHVDSVYRVGDEGDAGSWLRRWWRVVTRARVTRRRGGPTDISALAALDPSSPLVVVASESYVSALADDLVRARSKLDDPELLVIVSAATRVPDTLTPNIALTDARLQREVGGPRQSLNVRVAGWVLRKSGHRIRASSAKRKLANLLARQPELVSYNRRRLGDEEVRRIIGARLASDRTISRTRLLRELRDAGDACEQSRFARLFNDTTHVDAI